MRDTMLFETRKLTRLAHVCAGVMLLLLAAWTRAARAEDSAPRALLAALQEMAEEYDDEGWRRLGELVVALSFEQARALKQEPTEHLFVKETNGLLVLTISFSNPRQNYVAVRGAGESTSWLVLPGSFLTVKDAALIPGDPLHLVLVGVESTETLYTFATVFRRTDAGWHPYPEAFRDVPAEAAGLQTEVAGLETVGSPPSLTFGSRDVESGQLYPQWVELALQPGPELLVGEGDAASRLEWQGDRFVPAAATTQPAAR
jgi:hypothetical protein